MIPIALAFLAGPLLHAGLHFTGMAGLTSAFTLRLWLAFCGITILSQLLDTGEKRHELLSGILAATFCAGTALLLFENDFLTTEFSFLLPGVNAAAPLIFGMLALACVWTWGLPSREGVQRTGGWLGLLVVCDTLFMLVFSRQDRLLGNPDMLATLLLVAMSASLKPREQDPEKESTTKWHRFWILAGLAATLSRTGLLTVAWAHLFFGRGSIWKRLPYTALCLALMAGGFLLELGLGTGSSRYLEYWVWLESIRLFLANPANAYTGFSLETPLPIVPPLGLMGLWHTIADTSPLSGLLIKQLHPFWLRVTMSWGMLFPCGIILAMIATILSRPSRMGAVLATTILAQGISTDLFFSPGPAVLLWLGLFMAFKPRTETS